MSLGPEASAPASAPPRSYRWLLGLLLVWALALRVWCGSVDLSAGRFWDERYGLANVESFLRTGSLAPVNAFHPTLSYIPQALLLGAVHRVHEATGWERWRVLGEDGFTPLGYFLCRLLQALFGVLSILLLVHLGCRLFDRWTGLLAGLLLAIVPWHLRQSAIFKPDVLLLLLGIVAVDWATRAVEEPSAGRYARAGAGVGLALSTKFNAGPLAIPLVVGTLARRQPSRWRQALWLGLAGLLAAAIFLLLNAELVAHPEMVRHDFGRTLRDYARKGTRTSHLGVAVHAVSTLLSPDFHGPLVGTLALAGMGWLAVMAVREEERRRSALAALLSFPPAYVGIYALVTSNPSPHNWLPLVPFTSLTAAVALVQGWRALAVRWPVAARPGATRAAFGLLATVAAVQTTVWVHDFVVPTTWRRAETLMWSATPAAGPYRYAVVDPAVLASAGRPQPPWQTHLILASSAWWSSRGLAAAAGDFEIYPLRAGGGASRNRAASADLTLLAPRLFALRGPSLALVSHPWRQVGPAIELAQRGWELPAVDVPPGSLVSFRLELSRQERRAIRLVWGPRDVPLWRLGRQGRFQVYLSPRLPPSWGAGSLRLAGDDARRVQHVTASLWSR